MPITFTYFLEDKRQNDRQGCYIQVTATELESTAIQFVNKHSLAQTSLAKWLSVRLRSRWLWILVPLKSLKLKISRLLRARTSLKFRQLQLRLNFLLVAHCSLLFSRCLLFFRPNYCEIQLLLTGKNGLIITKLRHRYFSRKFLTFW